MLKSLMLVVIMGTSLVCEAGVLKSTQPFGYAKKFEVTCKEVTEQKTVYQCEQLALRIYGTASPSKYKDEYIKGCSTRRVVTETVCLSHDSKYN